jgi:hypothetical protein
VVALGELLPPVVAELRGNISDFQANLGAELIRWSTST